MTVRSESSHKRSTACSCRRLHPATVQINTVVTLTSANVLAVMQGRVSHTLEMNAFGMHPPRSHHEAVNSLIGGNGRGTGDVPGGSGGAARIAAADAP